MTDPIPAPLPPPEAARYRWYHLVMALVFIMFCMTVGTFLLLFPWSDLWDRNLFPSLAPDWRLYWDNSYFRGAVSGLGIVNVYISLVEVFRLRRFVRRAPEE